VADVTVFVDDAVLGRLPSVCAKHGEWTEDRLTVTQQVGGGLGAAWLLLLLGPIGWIALFVVAAMAPAETITVTLPFCDAAYGRLHRAIRDRRVAVALAVVAGLVALVVVGRGGGFGEAALAPAALSVLAVAAAVVASIGIRAARVHLRIDASRRWVTLSGVHPDFAAAVLSSERADRRR